MICHNCGTEKTPMWRRTLDNETHAMLTLCNACGLYYRSKNKHRPTLPISKKKSLSTSELIDKLIIQQDGINSPNHDKIILKNIDVKNLSIIHCANCQNINTSIWRKDDQGRNICNACGLYFKKKGYHRTIDRTNEVKTLDGCQVVNNDVFLEIDDNLIRFNRIKRRKRSSASSDSSTTSIPAVNPTIESQSPPSPTPVPPVDRDHKVLSSSLEALSLPTPDSPLNKEQLSSIPLFQDNYKLSKPESIDHKCSIDQQCHLQYTRNFNSTKSVSMIKPRDSNERVILPSIRFLLNPEMNH